MASVILKNGSLTVAAAKASTDVYLVTAVNGTYNVYVNGVYTGVDITVNDAVASADVNHYTVTSGTQGGSTVVFQTVLNGSKVAIPAVPTKNGNAVSGWYTDSGYGTTWNFSVDILTGNTALSS